MMNRYSKKLLAALTAVLAAGSLFAADAAPITGAAKAINDARQVRGRRGSVEFTVPVTVDLTEVNVNGRMPVLGAYVARVEFDPERVTFVSVNGGSDAFFSKVPFFTNTSKANAEGVVRIAYVQTETLAPSGQVNVAEVLFREKVRAGRGSVKVTLESLAMALERDADGSHPSDLAIPIEKQD